MSTDLVARPSLDVLPEVMEQVVAHGDLSKLSANDRVAYYCARCDAAGLDPRARPFEFILLQGKLVLYATKQCADLLSGRHGLSAEVVSRGAIDGGLYEAVVRVRFPDGRHAEDVGIVEVAGKRGGDLANAMMKAVTKARRRATLSLCGLGDVIDESELDTVEVRECTPTGQPKPLANNSGHATGQYASPEQSEAWRQRLEAYIGKRNAAWLDRWTDELTGEIPAAVRELCNIWQADNHLLKWCRETGRLDPASGREEGQQNRQICRFTAIVLNRSRAEEVAMTKELARYLDELERRQTELIRSKHPELFGKLDGDSDELQAMADDDPPGEAS